MKLMIVDSFFTHLLTLIMYVLFNPMVQKFMVEKSGVEKFMVEKTGVERSGVEAWV